MGVSLEASTRHSRPGPFHSDALRGQAFSGGSYYGARLVSDRNTITIAPTTSSPTPASAPTFT